jgi:hypothetical protein
VPADEGGMYYQVVALTTPWVRLIQSEIRAWRYEIIINYEFLVFAAPDTVYRKVKWIFSIL